MLPRDWINHLDKLPEDSRLPRTSLTEVDIALKAVWDCAFPERLTHEQTDQLIYRMYEIDGENYPMSMREVAHHIGIMHNVHYVMMLNEVYGVGDTKPDEEFQAFLQERMESCRYYEWLYSLYNEE